jgi:hypothetical protein
MKNSIAWTLAIAFALAFTGGVAFTGCKTTVVVKHEKDKRPGLHKRADKEIRDTERRTQD